MQWMRLGPLHEIELIIWSGAGKLSSPSVPLSVRLSVSLPSGLNYFRLSFIGNSLNSLEYSQEVFYLFDLHKILLLY